MWQRKLCLRIDACVAFPDFIANVENQKIIKLSVLLFHKTESLGPYQRMHVTNVLIDFLMKIIVTSLKFSLCEL